MLRFRLQPILCTIVILECSVGKGAPWGMVLVANPSKPHVITSLFPPPEDQRLLRVPEWGILSVKMLHWFCQASICRRANSIIIRQSRGPCKGGKTNDARPIIDCCLHKKVVASRLYCLSGSGCIRSQRSINEQFDAFKDCWLLYGQLTAWLFPACLSFALKMCREIWNSEVFVFQLKASGSRSKMVQRSL